MAEKRTQGSIKFFHSVRFFGFLTTEEGKEYFFHGSDFEGNPSGLVDGDKVSFELGEDEKTGREKALKVQLIKE